jgi:hypothetical protein
VIRPQIGWICVTLRVVLKIWEIYGPEIRAKIPAEITKFRHFKAKKRFFCIFSAVYVRIGLILMVRPQMGFGVSLGML